MCDANRATDRDRHSRHRVAVLIAVSFAIAHAAATDGNACDIRDHYAVAFRRSGHCNGHRHPDAVTVVYPGARHDDCGGNDNYHTSRSLRRVAPRRKRHREHRNRNCGFCRRDTITVSRHRRATIRYRASASASGSRASLRIRAPGAAAFCVEPPAIERFAAE